jgi:hypothetical protein
MKVFKDNEKPPAGPRERLAMVQDALGDLPHQYSVEFVNDDSVDTPTVYLNYDFSTAVCIGWDDEFKGYRLEAMHWAPDHGVDDEHEIGLLFDASVAAQVAVQFAKDHESM